MFKISKSLVLLILVAAAAPASDLTNAINQAQGFESFRDVNYNGVRFLAVTPEENRAEQSDNAQARAGKALCSFLKKGPPVAVSVSWHTDKSNAYIFHGGNLLTAPVRGKIMCEWGSTKVKDFKTFGSIGRTYGPKWKSKLMSYQNPFSSPPTYWCIKNEYVREDYLNGDLTIPEDGYNWAKTKTYSYGLIESISCAKND